MIRYQVRNEYGLADPELYAPAEKDDPEALLEGVAMAGLVGVLRQLGDLAEFAAEIFHDLHEDVMATASRGHGLMLRLQQLEAEFPAVEKAIICQTDHSNYPHDDGVEWHAHLQLNQNMITIGDMPRFILDSYEECRGPPHLFTLDKFDVAGAGASLKRYSDPSFFKTEHASNMIEINGVREKKPRKIKKRAMRWRKGETLEALLVANSESQSTSSKDRASRKVPPRTTKLKSRHPRDSDHKSITRICREQLQEVISSQQKILSNYPARHHHANFRSTDSSETSSFGQVDNFSAPAQSSAKLELTKVVPINEYDTVEVVSTPINGSVFPETDDDQFMATQHGHAEPKEISKKSLVEQNVIFSTSEKLQDSTGFKVEENNVTLQSVREEKLQLAVIPVHRDDDRCRPIDIGSDQDNFVDALNTESEGEADREMKAKEDLSNKMEADKLNCRSKEVENALHVQVSDLGPAIDLSGLNDSCNGREPTCTGSPLSDSSSAMSGINWTSDKEPFNNVDLMDVSSSSSVLSDDNGNFETKDNLIGPEHNQEVAFLSSNDYHADVAHSSVKQSPQTSSGLDGLAINSNDYDEKAYGSVERGQNFVVDGTSMIFGHPNDVSQDDGEIEVPDADDMLLHHTMPNQEQIQLFDKQFKECASLDTGTSPSKLASLPDMDPIVQMNNLELDSVAFPEEIYTNTTPTGLDPDDIHRHFDGVAQIHSSTLSNPLYESDDDEIVEELHCLPDEDLYKYAAEDQETVALGKGPSIRLDTHKEDPMEASIVPRHFCTTQGIPGVMESVSPVQDDTEACVSKTPAPSSCLLNDDIKPSSIGGPLASSTASLLGTSSSCMEHRESIEIGKHVECCEVRVVAEVAEESTTSMCEDYMIPLKEECTDGAKYSEESEVLATNSREEHCRHDVRLQSSSPCREDLETVEATCENLGSLEESREWIFKESMSQTANLPEPIEIEPSSEVLATNSREEHCRHDVRLQSSSPCREDLETVEATCENLGSLEESREWIFKESMSQTANLPEPIEIEPSGETFSGSDDVRYLPSLHLPEEPICQEELPEETLVSAEVPSQRDLDKDGAVSLKIKMVGEQPSDVDQDLVRDLSSQDSYGTNPFMDPGYTVSHAAEPSSSMSYQPCCSEEEQDFLSKLLIQHGNMDAKLDLYPLVDSLWESATPPDEAPLLSEVMTEEDFRSFCHEYHEMDSTAVTEGFDDKSSSYSNDITNGCVVSKQPAGLYQEEVCPKPDSQLAECSSSRDTAGETFMPFSTREVPDGETPGVDSDLRSNESLGDEKIPELDIPSVTVELERERHALPGVDSDSGTCLLDNEKIGGKYGAPSDNIFPVKEEQETCTNLVPHALINGKPDILDILPLSKPVLAQESEVRVLDELDSQIVPSVDKTVDDLDVPPLRTALEADQESEDCISGEHDSQIATSLISEKIDEPDAPPSSHAVLVEKEPEACVPGELDSEIAPCSLPSEKISEPDHPPLSGSVLVKDEWEDHVSGDPDSRTTSSSVNDKIDGPDAATSINVIPIELGWEACSSPELENVIPVELGWEACSSPELENVIPVELGWEACSSPELDAQSAPCPLIDDKVGELDGPPSCYVQVESENGSYCSPEFDSQIAPASSNSGAPAETSTMTCTSVIPSTEEHHQFSPVPPRTEPFPNVTNEDPEKPPPLPPLQWRLGKPRLGLLSTNGHMPEPVRGTTPVLPASSQENYNSPGSLNRVTESIASVSSQEIKERYPDTMVDDNDQRVEFEQSSAVPVVTDVSRTEHDRPVSEACENIKHQEHMTSSATEAREHGINQQGPQPYMLHSDISDSSEHPSHTDPTASEDEKMVDDYNATGGVDLYIMSSSARGHVSENGCYQQPQHGESFSQTSDNEVHSSNASYEEKNMKDQSITCEASSGTTNHTPLDSVLEEGNIHENPHLQEQVAENPTNNQSEGPSPIAESIVSQDCQHGGHNLERENIHQSNPFVSCPGDKSKYVSGLDEGSYVKAEQPPVMGWTIGPQMLHPNYGTSVEGSRFGPEVTDHRLIRKPISIKNIPRNPLVDAVAAHDRSTMRKVSELVPPTDKANPNERNLLLEQIRNKTFDLKPVGSAKPTSIRGPARSSTRNLKVAAIIEKANAIRQAVGSDDEDEDNWSDT